MTAGTGQGSRIAAAVTDVVEDVFATVAQVRAAALEDLQDGGPQEDARFPGLSDQLQALLRRPGQLACGLGLMVAPPARLGVPVQLHWWQVDPAGEVLRELDPDLRPDSVGFYDYTTAPWFAVPRRTGGRHVTGPHVDVHGTGQYLLTFTVPVTAWDAFLGVAGVDVPVSRFEAHLLGRLEGVGAPFLLADPDGRVVLSTSPWWLVGTVLPEQATAAVAAAVLPGTPWRLYLADDAGELRPA